MARVVFPDPVSPTRDRRSPAFNTRSVGARAVLSSYRLVTPLRESMETIPLAQTPDPVMRHRFQVHDTRFRMLQWPGCTGPETGTRSAARARLRWVDSGILMWEW